MSHIHNMTTGSPARCIFSFALPLIAGYILQQMYLVIDAIIVGRWIGVGALAAVGASSSIMFLVMGFCNGACAGFAIPVATAFGARDEALMRAYVAHALRIAAVLAACITLVTCAACHGILGLLNTPADIWHDAYVFLFLQFLAIPFTMAYNLLAGFIRALGNSRQPFFFLIAASVLNVALDVLLILFLGLGVAGAGLATLLAQAAAAALCAAYIARHMALLIPRAADRRYHDHLVGRLLAAGIPMGLQFSITGIGIIMLQSANNALGTGYVAAFTACMRVKYLFTCVFENVGVAMATYCGQNIGARRLDRVAAGLRAALAMSLGYAVVCLLIILPGADAMMRLFVEPGHADVVANAARFMRICCYFYPVLGLLTILRYSIQGLGFSNLSMLSGVMEMLARTGVSLWLVPAFGFVGVCFGDPTAWLAADLFLVPAYLYVYRRLRRLSSPAAPAA